MADSDATLMMKPIVEVTQVEVVKATASAADYVRMVRSTLTVEENDGFTDAELEQVCRAAWKDSATNYQLVRTAMSIAQRVVARRAAGAVDAKDPRHPKFKPNDDAAFGNTTPHPRSRP